MEIAQQKNLLKLLKFKQLVCFSVNNDYRNSCIELNFRNTGIIFLKVKANKEYIQADATEISVH